MPSEFALAIQEYFGFEFSLSFCHPIIFWHASSPFWPANWHLAHCYFTLWEGCWHSKKRLISHSTDYSLGNTVLHPLASFITLCLPCNLPCAPWTRFQLTTIPHFCWLHSIEEREKFVNTTVSHCTHTRDSQLDNVLHVQKVSSTNNSLLTMRICLIRVSDARSVMLPTNTVVVGDMFPVELSARDWKTEKQSQHVTDIP